MKISTKFSLVLALVLSFAASGAMASKSDNHRSERLEAKFEQSSSKHDYKGHGKHKKHKKHKWSHRPKKGHHHQPSAC